MKRLTNHVTNNSFNYQIVGFEVVVNEKPSSIWKHWKIVCAAFIAGALCSALIITKLDAGDLEASVVIDRKITLELGSKHEHERNSKGPDGASPNINGPFKIIKEAN